MGKASTILILILISCVGFADECAKKLNGLNQTLSTQVTSKITDLLREESLKGVRPEKQTQVLLIKDQQGLPIKTPTSVVLIHGLYNSPSEMADLAAFFHTRGMNVINARLPGHYEKDESLLQKNLHWPDWLEAGRRDLELAQQLGDRVVLVGHSTGGLVLSWLAIENPKSISGLVLLSPAFRVQPITQAAAALGESFDVKFKSSHGKIVTGHAGVEVTKMAEAFKTWLHNMDSEDSYAATQLADVPVWMANTSSDLVISVTEAEEFLDEITMEPFSAPRVQYTIPASHFVAHNMVSQSTNPHLDQMIQSISDFLIPPITGVQP